MHHFHFRKVSYLPGNSLNALSIQINGETAKNYGFSMSGHKPMLSITFEMKPHTHMHALTNINNHKYTDIPMDRQLRWINSWWLHCLTLGSPLQTQQPLHPCVSLYWPDWSEINQRQTMWVTMGDENLRQVTPTYHQCLPKTPTGAHWRVKN